MSETTLASGFGDLRVAAHFCRILENQGITIPTPIQAEAIPVALEGKDLIGIAQTGTGKTLAFGLPMVENLKSGEVGLVLAPTRELAQQIAETYSKLNVQCVLVVGGASMLRQKHELRNNPKVIVATPGRLQDHMYQRTVRLNNVSIVVLDEADRMFDMGFAPAIMRILDELPENRQTMLFSATFPKDVEQLASRYQVDPVRIEVDKAFSIPDLIDQELVFLTHEEKKTKLTELLYDNQGTVLVFARTRHGARKLAKSVRDDGHTAAELHADRTLAQRREALAGFKQGHFRVLVATDIAARGIDVKDISLVINFDVPECADDYIHRIGRTGRAGAEGRAIMLAMPQQARDVKDIEKLMGMELRICDTSTSVPASFKPGFNPDSLRPRNRSERPNRAPRVERKERTRERDRLASAVTETPEVSTEERAPRAPQPERPWNHDRPSSENRPWNNDRPQGDRPYNRDSRPQGGGYQGNRPQGDRPFNRDSRPQGGDRAQGQGNGYQGNRPWNNDRPQGGGYQGNRPNNDERRPWSNDRPQGGGYQGNRPNNDERRPWSNDRPQGGGYQGNRPNNDERRPWSNDRTPREGSRFGGGGRPFNRDSQAQSRPWTNDRPQNGGDRPYNRDSRESRPWSNDRPQGDRPNNHDSRPQNGGDRSYNRESRPWSNDRPQGDSRPDKKPRWVSRDATPRPDGHPRFGGEAKPFERPGSAGRPAGAPWGSKPKTTSFKNKYKPKSAGPAPAASAKKGHRGWSGKPTKG